LTNYYFIHDKNLPAAGMSASEEGGSAES
jgi:hypothetical protein